MKKYFKILMIALLATLLMTGCAKKAEDPEPVIEETGEEEEALKKVVYILKNRKLIPFTGCRYCVEQNSCPMNIRIPDIFARRNHYDNFKGWLPLVKYKNELTAGEYGKASDCIKCGMCEEACPQHLEIKSLLEEAASVFEK